MPAIDAPSSDDAHVATTGAIVIAKRIGLPGASAQKLLAIGLTHPSIAGELRGSVKGYQIEYLRSLGKFHANLLLTHRTYEADPRVGAAQLHDARAVWNRATVQAETALQLYPLASLGNSLRLELSDDVN